MKEMMKRALSFITFEQLITKSQIAVRFEHLRNVQQQQSITLELIAARHKVIYEYWYNHVLKHFCFILLVATIITHLAISKINFPAFAIAGLMSYLIMYMFYYKFTFNYTILPGIEMIKEEYEQSLSEEIRKCKKAQYPNFTLLLIDHVRNEISAMPSALCDEKSAIILTQLYGVDTGSMKKNLEVLLMKNKRKHFTERKKTEYKKPV